jgi:ribulose-bisphosphate carboxylase large chain
MEPIKATYELSCPADAAAGLARRIALEQSVEVPEDVARAADLPAEAIGEVAAVLPSPDGSGRPRATIHFAADLSAFQLPQLLNLLYGNISILRGIRLVGLELPAELLARFAGPRHGEAGLRRMLGIYDRPLLATALKPRGAPVSHLADVARAFALGGGDIIKDDHNLVDATFGAFRTRVAQCMQAVSDANAETGRNTLYFPNLLPAAGELDEQAAFLVGLGVPGVLTCPYIIGLDAMRRLAERWPLAVMAHPALSGTFFHDPEHGIAPEIALGTLMRLAGADASVFPNSGGRFGFTAAQCRGIGAAMQTPLGDLIPGLPAPAGGMQFDAIPRMIDEFGPAAILLIGGALLAHSDDVRTSTIAFRERIEAACPTRQITPEPAAALGPAATSVCELASDAPVGEILRHLAFQPGFTWSGRTPIAYKGTTELPFRDVVRHELIGRAGEQARFDLRYFEVAPGGYTSLEKHVHTHTIITVRGRGVMLLDGEGIGLAPFDIAHTPPLSVHQLRNETAEPFGFFCIVDRERDRPQPP